MDFELLNLQVQQYCGIQGSEAIADGKANPDTIKPPEARKDKETGNKEYELACQREIDALAGLFDTLEEVASHHLETDDREQCHIDAHAASCHPDEFRICGKSLHDEFGKQFAEDEARGHHQSGIADGLVEDIPHAAMELCAVVVARYGLHPLIEAHDNHGEDEQDAVHYAVGSHGQVSALFHHFPVDKQHHEAGTGIHEEGRESDGEDAADYAWAQHQRIFADKDDLRGARKYPHLPAK